MASSKPFAITLLAALSLSLLAADGQSRVALHAINAGMLEPAPVGHGGNKSQGQGYLGIMVRDVTDAEVSTLHLKSAHGAEVTMVDHDGPAGKAGLRVHDVIVSVNGTSVDDQDSLHRVLRELQPGRNVSLNVCRDGSEQTVSATMANRAELDKQILKSWNTPDPADEPPASTAGSHSGFGHSFISGHLLPLTPTYTGARVDALGAQLANHFGVADGKGLLVHEVEPNSPAATAGLQAGDIVVRMNGNRVSTKSEWSRGLRDSKGHPVSLTVVRDRQEQTLTMVPDSKHRSAVEPPPPAGDGGKWMSMLLR